MSVIQSILLGLIQGITEFLPVSSFGHITILRNLFGIDAPGGAFFETMVHLGTLIAVFLAFSKDVRRMLIECIRMIRDMIYNVTIYIHNRKEQDAKRYRKLVPNNYRKLVVLILVTTFPTAILGYAAKDLVQLARETLIVPGVCMILTAFVLIIAEVSEDGNKIPKDVSYTNAFLIGVAQGLAVLPGLSRFGVTLAVCLMSGFEKRFALRYSFLASIPVVLGAFLVEAAGLSKNPIAFSQFWIYLVGAVAAGAAGCFLVKRMLSLVRRKKLQGFAVYCVAVGLVAIVGYMIQR